MNKESVPRLFVTGVERDFPEPGKKVNDSLLHFESSPLEGSVFIDHMVSAPQRPIPVVFELVEVTDEFAPGSYHAEFNVKAVTRPATIFDVEREVSEHSSFPGEQVRYAGETGRFVINRSVAPLVLTLLFGPDRSNWP